MRERQASPRITAQQLCNTLNRETAAACLPGGRVLLHPSNSVAEALTTQCSWGLIELGSSTWHFIIPLPPHTYMKQLPKEEPCPHPRPPGHGWLLGSRD